MSQGELTSHSNCEYTSNQVIGGKLNIDWFSFLNSFINWDILPTNGRGGEGVCRGSIIQSYFFTFFPVFSVKKKDKIVKCHELDCNNCFCCVIQYVKMIVISQTLSSFKVHAYICNWNFKKKLILFNHNTLPISGYCISCGYLCVMCIYRWFRSVYVTLPMTLTTTMMKKMTMLWTLNWTKMS